MAIVISEKYRGRTRKSGGSAQEEARFLIEDAGGNEISSTAAESAFIAALPPASGNLILSETTIEDESGGSIWTGTAIYKPENIGSVTINGGGSVFAVSNSSQHVTHSRETVGQYAAEGVTPADHKNAISVSMAGIGGVDLDVATFTFEEPRVLPSSRVTFEFKRAMFYLCNRYNDRPFLGFATGEVRFLGVRGSQRPDGRWDLTFGFHVQPNADDLRVGDITGIVKLGWDHLWVQYEEDPGQTEFSVAPIAAYVERVYLPGDFRVLAL